MVPDRSNHHDANSTKFSDKYQLRVNTSHARLNRLSEICADIAQVSLASIVIPFLFVSVIMGISYNNNLLVFELIVRKEYEMNVDNLGFFYLTLAILALAIAVAAFAVLRGSKPRK